MSLFMIAFSSFVIALSGALVPGPLFSITVAESARRGAIAGPLIIIGHGILELALVVLIILGITPFLASPSTKMIISIVGGLVLIIMGYGLIRDARGAKLLITEGEGHKGIHPVLSGVIGSISNPYWSIWWVTIGMGYLVSSLKFGWLGVAVFFIGHIMADLGWYSLISLAIAKGKKGIGDRGYRFLLYCCGTFLIFFGLWFLKGV
jgi:threonine/homoserine/homoserine lactone efflux protein